MTEPLTTSPADPGSGRHEAAALVFDVYGTLADTGVMTDVLRPLSDDAESIARGWRAHQLQISWLLSLLERYEDFDAVTAYALEVALAEAGVQATDVERRQVAEGLLRPTLFDDVVPALDLLREAGHTLAVLSNGSPATLEKLLTGAGIRDRFRCVVSVDEVRVFKPAPAVYQHAASRLGAPLERLWLVSANPFDAAGGKAAGMRVARVARGASIPYPFAAAPDVVVSTLTELCDSIGVGPEAA